MASFIPLNIEVKCETCGGTYITAAEGINTNRNNCPRIECIERRKPKNVNIFTKFMGYLGKYVGR